VVLDSKAPQTEFAMFAGSRQGSFFALGCVIEGGLGVVAWLLLNWQGRGAAKLADFDAGALAIGLVACAPLLPLPVWVARTAWPPVQGIRALIEARLLPALAGPVWRIASLCVLAGLGEELFFRAWLQGWLAGKWGLFPALAIASLGFGLCHAVSPAYAVMATLMGVYLGLEFHLTGSLPAVALTHALYGFLAIHILLRAWRARNPGAARDQPPLD
jgi:hypothetical protein